MLDVSRIRVMDMFEITMYTTCIGITKTDAVDNVLTYIGVRYSEMKVRNGKSILIIDTDDMILVLPELIKVQHDIMIHKG